MSITMLRLKSQLEKRILYWAITRELNCYESMLKELSKEATLILSNTRELDRVPSTKQSTLYTNIHGPC